MKKYSLSIILLLLVFSTVFGQGKFFRTFADNGYDFGQGIVQLEDSSYMITGSSSSFIDAPSQVFMLKLDKFGEHQWAKSYGGSESDWGRRILNWNDSIFFLTGHTSSFGNGGFDYYMIKVNKNGEFISEKTYGGAGWERMNDALITPDSSVIMVGQTSSTPDGNSNFYIVKTDHNGDTLWTRNFGSVGEDVLHSVKQLDDNTFYAVGSYYNQDSTMVKGAVVRFTVDGTVDWINQFGKYGEYELHDFNLIWGMLYAGGNRRHPIDGDLDEFILRLFQDGTYEGEENAHGAGDVSIEGMCLYGNNENSYVGSTFQNEFSAGGSVDVSITRFFSSLYWNVETVIVPFTMDDVFGEVIATSDGGAISVGSVASPELGGSAVYVLKIGVNDDFPVVDLSTTGSLVEIESVVMNDGFTIFPNPATDVIHFQLGDNESATLVITDLNGRVLYSETMNMDQDLNVSKWSTGMYCVNILLPDGTLTSKKLLIHN